MSTGRSYPPEALALFRDYRDRRERHRPPECDGGEKCWVRDGPPSISPAGRGGRCIGCCGAPPRPVTGRRTRGNADGPL
jgi:hypothetical protein